MDRDQKEMLPPAEMLSDEQLQHLLTALKKMLDGYNWSFVLQIEVPERIQYAAIRDNFDQEAKLKQWNMGFFELCRPGSAVGKCALGEYCQCAFFAEFFKDMIDEDLTPEEERARALEFEISHIKKKYGDDWMKYYPYHLDKNYDDENGNSYDYGFGEADNQDDDDTWWRRSSFLIVSSKMKRVLLIAFFLGGGFTWSTAQPNNPICITGYYSGNAQRLQTFPVEKLTHIIFSFGHPGEINSISAMQVIW